MQTWCKDSFVWHNFKAWIWVQLDMFQEVFDLVRLLCEWSHFPWSHYYYYLKGGSHFDHILCVFLHSQSIFIFTSSHKIWQEPQLPQILLTYYARIVCIFSEHLQMTDSSRDSTQCERLVIFLVWDISVGICLTLCVIHGGWTVLCIN